MNVRRRIWIALGMALLVGVVVGCTTAETPVTSPTADWPTALPPLAKSPTVAPLAPAVEGPAIREPGPGAAGVSNPTQAGLAAEGHPAQELPTITPRPTVERLPMPISAPDGVVLAGAYYAARARPAPGVLIVSRDRAEWDALATALQARGYAVLVVALRGFGATGGAVDWTLAGADVRAALAHFVELPGITTGQVAVIGAGTGANLALNACADDPGCGGAVLLSAGLDYLGITTPDAMARLGARPVLIVASENDDNNPADSLALDGLARGPHRLIVYPAGEHGAALLAAQPDLVPTIADWLAAHLPPLVPRP